MSGNQFIPSLKPPVQKEGVEHEGQMFMKKDNALGFMYRISQYSVLCLFGFLPIFFMPGLWASLGFNKVMLSLVFISIIIVFSCFMALRKTRIKTVLPISLSLFWLTTIIAFISGLSSGDTQDAIRGSGLEVQTAGFLAILALTMSVPLVLQGLKKVTLKAISLFTITASLVILYSLLRIIIGADFLSFGSFYSLIISPIGGFNDLGILSGMMVILGLITLALLPLRLWLQTLISLIIIVSLTLLAVINFFNIWIVVGFFALLLFVYLLTKDSLFQSGLVSSVDNSKVLIGISAFVCIVSAIFITSGDYAGNTVSKFLKVDYTEVVPSLEGTLGIARGVYEENALLGIGPNRFADAWRLYKDPVINQTIFWDTDFNTGRGFVPTLFVNLGLLGGLSIVAFHLFFLFLGYKILLRTNVKDSYWYYVGAVSFASSTFIWAMSYVYEPGAGMLLIGALFTGMTFVAGGALLPNTVKNIPLVVSRQRGFFMMAVVIIIISNTMVVLLSVTKQYSAQAIFSESQVNAQSVEEFEDVATRAFMAYPDDRFVSLRAQIQLTNLGSLLNTPNPTEEDQQRFLSIVEQAQIFADQALSQDSTNPDNHAILAGIYSGLAVVGINGAKERASSALKEAKKLDPQNPGYYLLAAQMYARTADFEAARREITESLKLKSNYTEALFLSAQLDIREGNTESAIATTRSIITLEPSNPSRYFQLGMLESSVGNYPSAILAFQSAINIDSQYANARYLLALSYLATDRQEDALEQLNFVAITNSDNQQLKDLIQQVESGDIDSIPDLGLDIPMSEISPSGGSVDVDTGRRSSETDLITPVNTISRSEQPTEALFLDTETEQVTEVEVGE